MDQVKIGNFLKELTQEQLAVKLGVSRRTVSRWETGTNMPDLDILIELSDFYEIDLGEILDGERRIEKMNKELEETVLKVADYSNEKKERFMKRLHLLFIAGFVGFVAAIIIGVLGLENTSPYEEIASLGLGLAFGMVIAGVIYTSRYASKIRAFKRRLLKREN